MDIAKLAKENGLYNIFVTNGYMSTECLGELRHYLDAANVDLKAFRDESYKKTCGGRLEPVKNSIKLMKKLGIWVEVTTLIVPGFNDSKVELKDIADFIAGVDNNIPWHVSRFHPDYKFSDRSLTPEASIEMARDLGSKAGLKYVYAGNVRGFGSDTLCHSCSKLLIKREGFNILEYNIKKGKCDYCNAVIPGLFVETRF
jgi:pyruvate formate lyase activating enzyme